MSPVDGLAKRVLEVSRPDADGVYRHGADKRARRTALVTEALRELWNQAVEPVTGDDSGVGLAAVGSLARGQLGPCSDLDLVIVYDPGAVSDRQVTKLAEKIWYPLWDSGLSLDHSVRTRQQCESVTDHDLPAAMGWLNVKPVAGDAKLIETIGASIHQRWRKATRRRLPELIASATERDAQFGQLPYLNQPNIKESRGGLRDAVLVSALAMTWLSDRPHGEYDDAVSRLLDVRDCLHLAAGKDSCILLSQYQPAVARMMGLMDPTIPDADQREGESVETLQMMLAKYGRKVAFALDSTASHASRTLAKSPRLSVRRLVFPSLMASRRPAPKFESLAEGVCRHEGEVVLAPGVDPSADAALPLRVAVAAAENGLPIAVGTLENLRRCPIRYDHWDDEMRDLLIRLLSCPDSLLRVWESIDYADVPGRLIPEWLGVRNRPSVSAAHRFTIDRHMIEVVTRLSSTTPLGGRYDDRHYHALLLAGLLHDIGKRPRVVDHAVEGSRHARVIVERLGYGADTADMVSLLVREHLALSDAAHAGSPDDAEVTGRLASALRDDPVLVDMLFDLTRADASSLGATPGETITGRAGWSRWQENLTRAMYQGVRRACAEGGAR